MKVQKPVFCMICGEPRRENDGWFLLTENRWTDRLKILSWNDQLVAQPGVYPACGAAHVQQLVVHWMAMGSLAHPFARVRSGCAGLPRKLRPETPADAQEPDTRGAKVIGELAVHRESLSRILIENPGSLASILGALISAIPGDRRPIPDEEGEELKSLYELTEV
jgi:hypothetical protein